MATEQNPLSTTARDPDPYWQPLIDEVKALAKARKDDSTTPCRTLGRFKLEEHIGSGGMGVVFKARDPKLDRVVALKLWNCHDAHASEALLHEAQCQAKVTHPHVVTIFETGMIDSDVYLAMEYVAGTDGRVWLERREHRSHWSIALAVLTPAGAGLAAVHARGLVHADFKPDNLLFGGDGNVRVADFGIARVLDDLDAKRSGDGPGTSGRGTPDYMAPERLERRWTDQRSDQFSFCVTLWEFVYGRRPFSGGTVEQLLHSMVRGPKTGDTAVFVPAMLRSILLKGLELDPDKRFVTMDELLVELGQVPFEVSRGRRRRLVSVGAVAVGFVGVFGGMAIERARSGRNVESHELAGVTPAPTTTIYLGGETTDDLPVVHENAWSTRDPETGDLEPDRGEDPPKPDLGLEPSLVDDETSQQDRDRLKAEFDAWAGTARLVTVMDDEFEQRSFALFQSFQAESTELQHHDPRSALAAARYAINVASFIPTAKGASKSGTAEAEEFLTTAIPRVRNLVEAVEAIYGPQSKHSTVPSTLE